jgi:hypothetical protein
MSRCPSWNSTVPTVECHALTMFMATFGEHGIRMVRLQARWVAVRRISFDYYRSWDTAERHADRPKSLSSESCPMHTWQAQSSLPQEVDLVYSTTYRPSSSRCRLDNPQSLRGAPVRNWRVSEKEVVLGGNGYISKHPCSIMVKWYVSHHQSNYDHRAWNPVEGNVLAWHLQIARIRF